MKILILGGAGFVGSNLVRRCLEDKKNKVVVVDNLNPRLKSTKKNISEVLNSIQFIKGDIGDAELMQKTVKNKDIIFNCAGQTSHTISLQDPFFDTEVNCLGNLTLLEAVRKYNKKAKVIYTSSSTVIGRAFNEVVDEDHRERPLDIYSANKGVAEKYYYLYHHIHGLQTLALRFANLYGPYGKGYSEFGFINYFIDLAFKNKPITIFGQGRQKRNVMYIKDAVDLLYKAAVNERLFGSIYFAVHREHYSVKKIAQEIAAVFNGEKGKIVYKDWPRLRKRIEIDKVIISGAKLFYEMKWEPKYSLREGLKETKKIMEADL